MDKLKQSAISFAKLMNYEYELVAGSKKTLISLKLFFQKKHFMHLIGLHKLTDLQLQRYSKEKMYDMILNDELTYEYIQRSEFFLEISERIDLFPRLEQALDNNELMIKYNSGFAVGTVICASYIILCEFENTTLHFFIDYDETNERYFGRSFFGRTDDKFTKGQQKFKILKKYKKNIKNNTTEILVDKNVLEKLST